MTTTALDETTIRTIVDQQLEKRLHPGLPDPRYYIHAEVRDPQTGHVYRGMLYLVEPIEVTNDKE